MCVLVAANKMLHFAALFKKLAAEFRLGNEWPGHESHSHTVNLSQSPVHLHNNELISVCCPKSIFSIRHKQ